MPTSDGAADPFGWIGHVLDGRYRIDRVIGSGGFGVVYRAEHIALGGPVAVKCLDLRRLLDPARQQSFLRAFLDEGRILHNLASKTPAVVRVLDLNASTSPWNFWTPYLVLEWLEGDTLATYIARRWGGGRPIELHEAFRLLSPIASALETAHAIGIAHRDVKPANVFVVDDVTPTVKILDFGIAKVMSDQLGAYDTTGESLQAFSAAYGAPEQFEPGAAGWGATGPWTDVYALALILIEMVSGRRAYEGTNPAHFHAQATNRTVRPSLAARGVQAPAALEHLLQRALAVDPRNRPSSAGQFWRELERIATSTTTTTVARQPPTRVPAGPTPEMLPVLPAPSPVVESSTTAPRARVPPPPRTKARSASTGRSIAAVGVVSIAVFGVAYALNRNPAPEPATAASTVDEPEPPPDRPKKAKPVPTSKAPKRVAPTELVLIRGGKATFGTNGVVDNKFDESPPTSDMVADFSIEKYEVSVAQYKQCVDDGNCTQPSATDKTEPADSCNVDAQDPSLPIACVNYEQAKTYCSSIGRRLPTAREWELAARGTAGHEYPWGTTTITCADAVYGRATSAKGFNSTECASLGSGPLPVHSPRVGISTTGVFGLAGNVGEWTSSDLSYFEQPGKEIFGHGVHGGAWTSFPNRLRGYRRWIWSGTSASSATGIRCAADAP